jgi:hypothetical protein
MPYTKQTLAEPGRKLTFRLIGVENKPQVPAMTATVQELCPT